MCDDCKHRILSALNWRVVLRKFKKYYPLITGPWKHLDWHDVTCSSIDAIEMLCQVKLTKMPLVNPELTKSQSRSNSSQNDTFHVSTLNLSYSVIFVNVDQIWPEVNSWGHQKLKFWSDHQNGLGLAPLPKLSNFLSNDYS